MTSARTVPSRLLQRFILEVSAGPANTVQGQITDPFLENILDKIRAAWLDRNRRLISTSRYSEISFSYERAGRKRNRK